MSASVQSPHHIDASRVCVKSVTDPSKPFDGEAPDSVWVPVVGRTIEDVQSIDARQDALRYVVEKFGQGDGIDQTEPPVPDDGVVLPLAVTVGRSPDARMTMSAQEYLRAAAVRQLNPESVSRYVAYYRVRRSSLI